MITGTDVRFTVTGQLSAVSAESSAVQLQLTNSAEQLVDGLVAHIPVTTKPGSSGEAHLNQTFQDFRSLFPAAMCYTRIVPIDEVVTLVLHHREDEHLVRLMLSEEERTLLNRLWADLRFVSQDAFAIVTGLEQLLEFATQDGDPTLFEPLRDPIAQQAAALNKRLADAESAQIDALVEFAAKAFRRPLTTDESSRMRALYSALRKEELPHDDAFRLVLARIFTSPTFLYRAENPAPDAKQAPVSDWELATRLSFFLTSSSPDASLLEAASQGQLHDQLPDHTLRLLESEKVRRLAVEFACQWLHVRDFDALDEKSESRFPEFTDLRGAMYEETIQFFTDLFQNDGSILEILTADYVFANDQLASFYGIDQPVTGWEKIPDARQYARGGILAMATTLGRQSGASRTSPILRGNWIAETLLGEKLPKPPAGVPPLPESLPAGLSERQLIERHSSDPACAKCHIRIDPYGFTLERYDAIGHLRELTNTATTLADGTALDGLDGLRDYLANTRRDAFVRQFCRKLLGYALGRAVQLSDEPLLDQMDVALQAADYRFSVAVQMIVNSRQFREIRGQQSASPH